LTGTESDAVRTLGYKVRLESHGQEFSELVRLPDPGGSRGVGSIGIDPLPLVPLVPPASQIKGTVQDSSGLVVPGAEIKVTQLDTGAVRTSMSGADGTYVFPSLAIGPYRLEVTKEGFTRYVQSGIVLQVDTNPEIDVSFNVGSVTEQIAVEAAASMVETQQHRCRASGGLAAYCGPAPERAPGDRSHLPRWSGHCRPVRRSELEHDLPDPG
jgi:hypothetical protein